MAYSIAKLILLISFFIFSMAMAWTEPKSIKIAEQLAAETEGAEILSEQEKTDEQNEEAGSGTGALSGETITPTPVESESTANSRDAEISIKSSRERVKSVSAPEKVETSTAAVVVMSSPQERRPWQPPSYSGQEGALGWSADLFRVPVGLESRVNFWKDIYTKYSTDQGVLHDSEHVGVVYAAIDFRPIMNDNSLSDREKSRARRKLVNDKKLEIRESLARLQKLKLQSGEVPSGLSEFDQKVWQMFASIDEDNKFLKAQHRKRLRFQLGQSDRFLQGIHYSGRYLPEMERIFRERGMPIELTRLPFVESSFNVKARSRVGASGIWQFMRYTGRRFMRINYAVDERNDPIRSAEAAARLFRLNYEMLGKWPLAITGYNHGPAGVQRVVRKFQTDNIVELVDERHGRFGFASANFYACFLAALEVEKNAKKYFGDEIYWDSPFDAKEIRIERAVNKKMLVKWFGGNETLAKEMNPHFLRSFWTGYANASAKDFIRVPSINYELALQDLKSPTALTQLVASRGPNGDGTSDGGGGTREIEYYLINHGETLSEIAVQHGVSLNALIELNGIDSPRSIRAGQKIMIPPARK